jgi:hypothetical protein
VCTYVCMYVRMYERMYVRMHVLRTLTMSSCKTWSYVLYSFSQARSHPYFYKVFFLFPNVFVGNKFWRQKLTVGWKIDRNCFLAWTKIANASLDSVRNQGCQIFLDAIYQNEGKYVYQITTTLPNGHKTNDSKIFLMVIKYTIWP